MTVSRVFSKVYSSPHESISSKPQVKAIFAIVYELGIGLLSAVEEEAKHFVAFKRPKCGISWRHVFLYHALALSFEFRVDNGIVDLSDFNDLRDKVTNPTSVLQEELYYSSLPFISKSLVTFIP